MNKELLYDSETGEFVSGNDDKLFQNRDIIKWMDRIKRGEAFIDDARKVVNIIHEVLTASAIKYFNGSWKEHYETHEEPSGLAISSNMTAPTIHKEHADGDEDKYFIYFKEYPFCYNFKLMDTFSINPMDERMAANEDYYKSFYLSEVAPNVELDITDTILGRISREVGTDIFHIIRKGEEPVLNKINISIATAFKLNGSNTESDGQSKLPGTMVGGESVQTYLTSEDLRNAIERELSIAMGRLTPIEELIKRENQSK